MVLLRLISRGSVSLSLLIKCAWILLLAAYSFAGQPTSVSAYRDPTELVRKAVSNEINAGKDDTPHYLFRGTKTTSKETTTRLYAENQEATAGLLIASDGQPLTPEQRQAEESRLERLISHPEELKKKREKEHADGERTLRIMRALPDAFLFELAGEEIGGAGIGRDGGKLLKLKFHPNPRYEPPSHVEEVLTGMEGYVLVDPVVYRLASIDGTLFKEVGFGWGILGHLDRGSRFVVQQIEVGDNVWEISRMTLNFTGKIMLFKNLTISSKEVFTDFKPVPPNLTFAEAFEMLKKEEATELADKSCCQTSAKTE